MSKIASGHSHLIVSGWLDDDQFIPALWVSAPHELIDSATPRTKDENEWWVEAFTTDGASVVSVPMTVRKVPVCGTLKSRLHLSAHLPISPELMAISVKNKRGELYRRESKVRGHLNFATKVPAKLKRGLFKLGLRIDSAVPSDGGYIVLRWESPYSPPTPMELKRVDSSVVELEVDLNEVPGGESCKLVAVYNDGIRS